MSKKVKYKLPTLGKSIIVENSKGAKVSVKKVKKPFLPYFEPTIKSHWKINKVGRNDFLANYADTAKKARKIIESIK